ncbi:hypothetical protein PCANB_001756 [Pneumocystis canis]|nr:hypothetical protein PCANB_001756 [Pneumocystis canis]
MLKLNILTTISKQKNRTFFCLSYHQNLIKELYLKELKNCKPYVIKSTDFESQVKSWKLPNTPEIPKINLDISSELSAYEEDLEKKDVSKNNTLNSSDNLFKITDTKSKI